MSATIADDSEIVRTFDASRMAVAKPVTSESLAGVGERMILVPELMKLSTTPIIPMVKEIAEKVAKAKRGVAILSPSASSARQWSDIAECPNTTGEVSERVVALQSGETYGPIALANRYDGIDLAGNTCRFLILDNLPRGATNYDLYVLNVAGGTAINSLLAQRIEQGIGRGTRGGGDYCVVILIGSKLVGWIGRRANLDFLTSSTRVQLKMGQEISEEVTSASEVRDTIRKCLKRDTDWISYHASELSEAAHAAPVDEVGLRIAAVERKAFRDQRLGQYERALAQLEQMMDEEVLKPDRGRVAGLAAMAARIAYQNEDETRGQELQTRAFVLNNSHSPPRVRPTYAARSTPGRQSRAIVKRLQEYEQRAGIIADFSELVSDLVPEASAARYEEGLARLGTFLGFRSERPERVYGIGPDVLWRTDGVYDFVIEAKSKKDEDSPLYKKDHAQLLEAEHWFKQTYPDRGVLRVSALPEAVADERATPAGSYALRLSDIDVLVSALRSLLVDMVNAGGSLATLEERCEIALKRNNLTPNRIKENFLKPFGTARRGKRQQSR